MINGPDGERVVDVLPPETILGSDAACDVVLDDPDVSPEHCKIQAVMSAWKVVDLESDAGTRVNGRYVNQRPLRGGDILELGELRIVFQDDVQPEASSAAPAAVARTAGRAGTAARQELPKKSTPSRRGRRAAVARKTRRAEAEQPPEQEERRPRRTRRRKSDAGVKMALVLGGLVIVAGGAFLALKDSSTPNQRVFMRMQAAALRMDYPAVVSEAQAGNLDDPEFGPRMRELLDHARKVVKSDEGDGKVDEATNAWNQIRVWLQDDNWKNHTEYVKRLDAFLAEYGHLGAWVIGEARKERARITGSAAAGAPKDAQDAWKRLGMDIEALEKNGKYGEAIAKADEFRKQWASQAPGLAVQADDVRDGLHRKAERWLAMRISRAWKKAEEGSPFQARRILEKAANAIGIEELRVRAAVALKKILAEHEAQ